MHFVEAVLGIVCLLVGSGCPDKKPASVSAADAGVQGVRSRDAGRAQEGAEGASSQLSLAKRADADLTDAGDNGRESSLRRPAIMPFGVITRIGSEQLLLRQYAHSLQWDTETAPLESYRREVARVDVGEWQFTLLHLANASIPRGGQQQWLLVRKPKKKVGPISYCPLITQQPFTPDYWQQVTSLGVTLQSMENESSHVLWVRLLEKFSESESGGVRIREKERRLVYAFLVDERSVFSALAFRIPEKMTLLVDDEVKAETSIELSFPSMRRLVVRPGPTGVDAEQRNWLGEHSLAR